jgi:hypothetical protein
MTLECYMVWSQNETVQRFLGPINISDWLTLPVIWHLLGWQLLLNFFPSPLANNFWTDLIFYLVSYVAFASMFTRWKVWMHLDKNKSERRKTQVWSFSFSFPWFRCCPVPSAFLSTDFNVFRIAQDLVIRGKEDSRIEFLFSFLNYYFFIILIYYI